MSFVEKFALTFLFLMAAPLLAAAPKPAKYGNFEVDSAGRLCFGDAVLDFQVWNEDWSQAVERKALKNFEGYPHIKKDQSSGRPESFWQMEKRSFPIRKTLNSPLKMYASFLRGTTWI